MAELIKTAPPELQTVLELRQQLAKSSVKKYQTMGGAVCDDGRARGMFALRANRTGRWAGEHTITKPPAKSSPGSGRCSCPCKIKQLRCREAPASGIFPDTLSQLILYSAHSSRRTVRSFMFPTSVPSTRKSSRGMPVRRGVKRSLKQVVFHSASQMFHVPVEEVLN